MSVNVKDWVVREFHQNTSLTTKRSMRHTRRHLGLPVLPLDVKLIHLREKLNVSGVAVHSSKMWQQLICCNVVPRPLHPTHPALVTLYSTILIRDF